MRRSGERQTERVALQDSEQYLDRHVAREGLAMSLGYHPAIESLLSGRPIRAEFREALARACPPQSVPEDSADAFTLLVRLGWVGRYFSAAFEDPMDNLAVHPGRELRQWWESCPYRASETQLREAAVSSAQALAVRLQANVTPLVELARDRLRLEGARFFLCRDLADGQATDLDAVLETADSAAPHRLTSILEPVPEDLFLRLESLEGESWWSIPDSSSRPCP